MKYMILIQPFGIYVKEKEFFLSQSGDKNNWGKSWEEVEANSIPEARELGYIKRDGSVIGKSNAENFRIATGESL